MEQMIKPEQRGFVLFMTLVTLVILTISGIAMMRVMEAGISASGNIAFRQAAIRVADIGVEDAVAWLTDKSGTVTLDAAATDTDDNTIYQPCIETGCGNNFDPPTYDWEGGGSHHMPDKVSGYDIYYVIHRVAQGAGPCNGTTAKCAYTGNGDTGVTSEGTSQSGGSGYSTFITGTAGLVYYRVTVRVSGPRNNVSYVQAFLF